MRKKIVYTDEPIEGEIIPNFLPSPENLVFKEKKTKITLTLSNKSSEFFKDAAKKHGASYQSMIRELLDFYVANQRS
jgi:predicted DNA binding CopG/RHH family protein